MIFLSYLTDFSYFSMEKTIPKIAGHGQNKWKIDIFERRSRWFQLIYFLTRKIPDK
jgi:hypothetical protein